MTFIKQGNNFFQNLKPQEKENAMLNGVNKRILGVVLIGMSAVAMAADQKGPNVGDKAQESESATSVSVLLLADKLAEYGIKAADPVAIIQAAKMKKSVATKEQTMEKKQEVQEKAAAAKEKVPAQDLSADALLGKAESMAAGNATLAALIADARATKVRGATRGATVHKDSVNARASDNYQVEFRGSELARIAVVGDGDTDLDLYVYDESGNEICRDTDRTDRLFCEWTPRWTGVFRIKIANLGNVYNRYALAMN
jgi:hypothetical protein